jgi:hypothetical protein
VDGPELFDFLIIDPDTVSYLLAITPGLRGMALVAVICHTAAGRDPWRIDSFNPPAISMLGAACLAGLAALSMAVPREFGNIQGVNHISNFSARPDEVFQLFTRPVRRRAKTAEPLT